MYLHNHYCYNSPCVSIVVLSGQQYVQHKVDYPSDHLQFNIILVQESADMCMLNHAISGDYTMGLNQPTVQSKIKIPVNCGKLCNSHQQILSCRQPWRLVCMHRCSSGETDLQYNQC